MSASLLETVPWISKEEWVHCRDQLFGSDILMKQRALEHLYVWKVRHAVLPIAIECTLILMEVHLKGQMQSNNEEFTNTLTYESWYSVSIMRFLNLIFDSAVGLKRVATMHEIAEESGIPSWIVDIRHTVAHGSSLPSLSRLKEAVEQCLQWLYVEYWSKASYDEISRVNDVGTTDSQLFSCFEVCLTVKRYLLDGIQDAASISLEDREKIRQILLWKTPNESCDLDNWTLDQVRVALLKKLTRHLNRGGKYGQLLVAEVLRTNQYFICADAVRNNELCVEFCRQWIDVISVLVDSCACVHLLRGLVDIVISPIEESWRKWCAAVYLNEILSNIGVSRMSRSAKKKKRRYGNTVEDSEGLTLSLTDIKLTDDDVRTILDSVLAEPIPLVTVFLSNLLKACNLPAQIRYDVLELFKIYVGESEANTTASEPRTKKFSTEPVSIHTLLQLTGKPVNSEMITSRDKEFDQVAAEPLPEPVNMSGQWSWDRTPLGILPWQTQCNPWLQLYDSDE